MICRLCSSKETQKNFGTYQCAACGVLFVDTAKSKIDLDFLYDKAYYRRRRENKNLLANLLVDVSESFSFGIKEKMIRQYFTKKEKITILDIGCGRGGFLEKLNSRLFEKFGFEASKDAYEISKGSKETTTYFGDFLKHNFTKKFDVICLWHVLEHLKEPIAYFNKIHKLLADKGIVVVSTPNTKSLGFSKGGKDWYHLDIPRHLFLYNEASFKFLCQRTNFKILKTKNEFYDYSTDLFWSLKKNKAKFFYYLIYPLLKIFSKETITFICQEK